MLGVWKDYFLCDDYYRWCQMSFNFRKGNQNDASTPTSKIEEAKARQLCKTWTNLFFGSISHQQPAFSIQHPVLVPSIIINNNNDGAILTNRSQKISSRKLVVNIFGVSFRLDFAIQEKNQEKKFEEKFD